MESEREAEAELHDGSNAGRMGIDLSEVGNTQADGTPRDRAARTGYCFFKSLAVALSTAGCGLAAVLELLQELLASE